MVYEKLVELGGGDDDGAFRLSPSEVVRHLAGVDRWTFFESLVVRAALRMRDERHGAGA